MSDVQQIPEASAPVDPTLLGGEPNAVKNWAEDPSVVARIKRELIPVVDQIRTRKQPLNEHWRSLMRVWTMEHEDQGYVGRSNIYMPAGRKGMETLVSNLVAATFPGDDFFDMAPGRDAFQEVTSDAKAIMRHRVDNTAKLRVVAERFYRQLVSIGNAPAKIVYDRRTRKTKVRTSGKKGDYESTRAFSPENFTSQDTVLRDTPVFCTLQAENFYVFPENVNSLDDAEIIFEDIQVSLRSLREKARMKIYAYDGVAEELKAARNPEKDRSNQARLQAQGIQSPHDVTGGYGVSDLTEVWLDFDPKAKDLDEERDPVPFLITITSNGCVLRAVQNPFWHQHSPYVLGRAHTLEERIWGSGFLEAIKTLNLLLNDQMNQAMDCGTYALNPIILTDPSQIVGKLNPLEPGVQWLVKNVETAVRFERPPADLIQAGSVMTNDTQSRINDFIGAPPVLQGGSSPGRAFKTATGIGTAQRNAMTPLQEVVRLLEKDVWEPTLEMFCSLDQQFAKDDYFVAITGHAPRRISPQALNGNWLFQWLASTQAQNQSVKGQQILQLLQVLGPMTQLLAQNGTRFNPRPLVAKLYTEVMGFRDVDQVLVDAPPPAAPGAPPGAPGAQVPPPPPNAADGGDQAENRMAAEGMSGAMGELGAFGGGGDGDGDEA